MTNHNPMEDSLSQAPLMAHLSDLRKRLIYSFIAFFIAAIICFYFIESIFIFLLQPLQQAMSGPVDIIYLAPHEAFMTYMNLAIYVGLLCALPLILIQVWAFIAPGLYTHEKKAFLPFLIMTPLMFYIGCAFAFYGVLPNALTFFADFQSLNQQDLQIIQQTRVKDYAHFVLSFILVFGLAFEMPVGLILSGKAGLVTADFLKKGRAYAVMIIAVLSAFFTPPDLISMFLLAFPLYFMYEVSIIWISSFSKKE